ncbi:MAG: hypothetical protein HY586_08240, partial [Candidatus Omnitrophica bacterium]|nr:hypothetical protein [Candidatus Omnitrophota bacterium]
FKSSVRAPYEQAYNKARNIFEAVHEAYTAPSNGILQRVRAMVRKLDGQIQVLKNEYEGYIYDEMDPLMDVAGTMISNDDDSGGKNFSEWRSSRSLAFRAVLDKAYIDEGFLPGLVDVENGLGVYEGVEGKLTVVHPSELSDYYHLSNIHLPYFLNNGLYTEDYVFSGLGKPFRTLEEIIESGDLRDAEGNSLEVDEVEAYSKNSINPQAQKIQFKTDFSTGPFSAYRDKILGLEKLIGGFSRPNQTVSYQTPFGDYLQNELNRWESYVDLSFTSEFQEKLTTSQMVTDEQTKQTKLEPPVIPDTLYNKVRDLVFESDPALAGNFKVKESILKDLKKEYNGNLLPFWRTLTIQEQKNIVTNRVRSLLKESGVLALPDAPTPNDDLSKWTVILGYLNYWPVSFSTYNFHEDFKNEQAADLWADLQAAFPQAALDDSDPNIRPDAPTIEQRKAYSIELSRGLTSAQVTGTIFSMNFSYASRWIGSDAGSVQSALMKLVDELARVKNNSYGDVTRIVETAQVNYRDETRTRGSNGFGVGSLGIRPINMRWEVPDEDDPATAGVDETEDVVLWDFMKSDGYMTGFLDRLNGGQNGVTTSLNSMFLEKKRDQLLFQEILRDMSQAQTKEAAGSGALDMARRVEVMHEVVKQEAQSETDVYTSAMDKATEKWAGAKPTDEELLGAEEGHKILDREGTRISFNSYYDMQHDRASQIVKTGGTVVNRLFDIKHNGQVLAEEITEVRRVEEASQAGGETIYNMQNVRESRLMERVGADQDHDGQADLVTRRFSTTEGGGLGTTIEYQYSNAGQEIGRVITSPDAVQTYLDEFGNSVMTQYLARQTQEVLDAYGNPQTIVTDAGTTFWRGRMTQGRVYDPVSGWEREVLDGSKIETTLRQIESGGITYGEGLVMVNGQIRSGLLIDHAKGYSSIYRLDVYGHSQQRITFLDGEDYEGLFKGLIFSRIKDGEEVIFDTETGLVSGRLLDKGTGVVTERSLGTNGAVNESVKYTRRFIDANGRVFAAGTQFVNGRLVAGGEERVLTEAAWVGNELYQPGSITVNGQIVEGTSVNAVTGEVKEYHRASALLGSFVDVTTKNWVGGELVKTAEQKFTDVWVKDAEGKMKFKRLLMEETRFGKATIGFGIVVETQETSKYSYYGGDYNTRLVESTKSAQVGDAEPVVMENKSLLMNDFNGGSDVEGGYTVVRSADPDNPSGAAN